MIEQLNILIINIITAHHRFIKPLAKRKMKCGTAIYDIREAGNNPK